MSKTNQVCITCTQRDTCQYYSPNRTICVPIMTGQEMQFELMKSIEKANELRQEVSSMNEAREYWTKLHHQAAIAAMQGQLANDESIKQMIEVLGNVPFPDKTKAYMRLVAQSSVMLADALIEELKGGQDEG